MSLSRLPSRTSKTMLLAAALLAAAHLVAGCRPAAFARDGREGATVLHAPSAYPGEYLLRQHVTVRVRGREGAFDAVVQKRGNELLLVGLTPFGTRAFTLRQTGTEVALEKSMEQELPFPPRAILYDVHRALLKGVPGSPPAADTTVRAVVDDEIVEETWRAGHLATRRFRKTSGEPKGSVVVAYEPPRAPGDTSPFVMSLTNDWMEYALTIETTEVVPLDGP